MTSKSDTRYSLCLCPYIDQKGQLYYAREYQYKTLDGVLYRIIFFPNGEKKYLINTRFAFSMVHIIIELHFAEIERI